MATAESGVVAVTSTIANHSRRTQSVQLVSRAVRPQRTALAEAIERRSIRPGARLDAAQSLELSRPLLWSPDSPNLYTLIQQVRVGGVTVDERHTRFGIRTVTFDARSRQVRIDDISGLARKSRNG